MRAICQTVSGPRPCTLALRESQSFLCRELTDLVIIVIVIVDEVPEASSEGKPALLLKENRAATSTPGTEFVLYFSCYAKPICLDIFLNPGICSNLKTERQVQDHKRVLNEVIFVR